MASALTALANATASFTVPTTGTTTDPNTGNVEANTEAVAVTLYLRQGSPSKEDLPGIEVDADFFEGYAISPQALDARIKPGTRGTLNFSGQGSQTCEVLSSRFPYGTTGLIGSTVQQVIGDRVRIVRYRQR